MIPAGKQVDGFAQLQDDGTTACGCWVYSGCYTEKGNQMARRDNTDPGDRGIAPNWAWAWPACPFNIPRISQEDRKAYKCTLCSDRVAVGQAPACAKSCPTGAIMFGTKEAMIEQADTRVVDLKSRGFDKAGLYNPLGVGGTHVMYVLHHADKPEIYANLPNNPRISPLVNFWKGGFKVFGLAGLAFTAIAGFLHYVTAGPDEVPAAEEQEAAKEAEGKNDEHHSA